MRRAVRRACSASPHPPGEPLPTADDTRAPPGQHPRVPSTIFGRISAFLRLGRPIFLVGGFVFYGLGAAIAFYRLGRIDWPLYAWGQAAVTAMQLMTHYGNDYFDLQADRANRTPTRWSGGSRVLPNGELLPATALAAAVVLALLAVLVTAFLRTSLGAGQAASPLLLGAVALAWEYSAPPLRLHSRGLGELDTAIVMTLLVPLVGFYLQARRIETVAVAAVAPLCLLQFAMLLAVEFPDEAGDAAVGKRTLVVRLGAPRARRLYVATLGIVYLLLPVYRWLGLPPAAGLAILALSPLAAWLARDATRDAQVPPRDATRDAQVPPRDVAGSAPAPRRDERVAFGTVALLVATGALELGVFVRLAS
jgi:1,4-dihydroxy-2-naphthoate octaprenyltransferase